MLGLARFAMKSPMHTGILAAFFAAVPMGYVLSAPLVALAILRHGLTAGTRILLMALAGALVSWQMSGIPLSLLVLPMSALLALVLRETKSWSRTLVTGTLLGLVLAFIAQMLFIEQFSNIIDVLQDVISGGDTGTIEWQLFESLRPFVGFLILASQSMEAFLMLALARYWQSGLYNPGGFKAEMHILRFTWQEVVLLIGVGIVAILLNSGAMLLFGIPFMFAGMAMMHGIVAKTKLGGQWLVAIYIGLVLFNQIIAPLLILAAMADSVFDFRSRIPEKSNSDDE